MTNLNLRDVLLQDFWVHVAGVFAVALGAADLWYFHAFSHDSDLLFMVGGFGAMGLKIVNGSAAALRTAALDTAFTAARSAQTAQQAATTAAVAAQQVTPQAPGSAVPPEAVGTVGPVITDKAP